MGSKLPSKSLFTLEQKTNLEFFDPAGNKQFNSHIPAETFPVNSQTAFYNQESNKKIP